MAEGEKINKPLILPQAKVPPKSHDLRSAFNALGNGHFCENLDQLRARYGLQGSAYVNRLDAAIVFLVLDMGYDRHELRETLEVAVSELIDEANIYRHKKEGKEAF